MIVIKMRLKTIAALDEGSRRSMYDSCAGAFALEHTITERYDERRVVQSIPHHQECNIIKQRKSMKRYLSCATVLMSLSACSSAGKLRDTVPTAVYVGSSSASDVVSCVSSAWATKHFQIDTVPLNTGTSLQLTENDGGPIMALVDITPTAGGTTTAKYYSQMPDDDTWFFQQVKSCM